MHIKEIRIEGLRGFGTNQVLQFAVPNGKEGSGLTILVGPNNAGKSTVIEAIRSFSQEESPSFTVGKRNLTTDLRIALKIINLEDEIKEIKTVPEGGSETDTIRINVNFEPSSHKIFVIPSRRYFNPFFGKGFLERGSYIQNNRMPSVRSTPIDNFSQRLFRIQQDRTIFNSILNRIMDPLPDWTIDQADDGRNFLKFSTGINSHSSDGVGEGIVSLFFIIDALYDSKPDDIIIIDEPELSLHPSFQIKLAKLFQEYSKDRQIVLSTHSPYFINFDSIANGTKIARVHLVESNSIISALSNESEKKIEGLINNLNNPHIFGLNAKEVFFLEDKILLVEGQEDVIFYNKLIRELGLKLNGDFFGWVVGGASNMQIISKLLEELGFKKVVGILDKDKEDLILDLKKDFPHYHYLAIPAKDVRSKRSIPAKEEVKGLLDEKNQLRDEYKKETIEMFEKLNGFLSDQ